MPTTASAIVALGRDDGLERIDKCLTTAEVVEFARRTRELSFRKNIFWSFVLGFPWETKAEIERTIEFGYRVALLAGSFEPHFSTYTLLPGSPAHVEGTQVQVPPDAYCDDAAWDFVPYQFCDLSRADQEALKRFVRLFESLDPRS